MKLYRITNIAATGGYANVWRYERVGSIHIGTVYYFNKLKRNDDDELVRFMEKLVNLIDADESLSSRIPK